MANYSNTHGESNGFKTDSGDVIQRHSSNEAEKTRRMNGDGTGSEDDGSADVLLESMGYQSELTRSRSTWQVAFMSFVLASIPYGLSTTFFYPLIGGGPANIIWGWVGVSLIIVCVAISLGEVCDYSFGYCDFEGEDAVETCMLARVLLELPHQR